MVTKSPFLFILLLVIHPLSGYASQYTFGPTLIYTEPGSAELYWETEVPMSATVIVRDGDEVVLSLDAEAATKQTILLEDLLPRTRYNYEITLAEGRIQYPGRTYELDTSMNYTVPSVTDDGSVFPEDKQVSRHASLLIQHSGISKAHALILGGNSAHLAFELVKQSDMVVQIIDTDRSAIQTARKMLNRAQVYGTRVTARSVNSLESLPMTSHFANLIVVTGRTTDEISQAEWLELMRVIRPYGGMLYVEAGENSEKTLENLNQLRTDDSYEVSHTEFNLNNVETMYLAIERTYLPGAGTWSHQYGCAGNSSNGDETLMGASQTDHMAVQWIGRPGANFGIDRNPRMPAPLAINGRIFHQGMNRMVAMDSFNGAILWSREIPDMRRVNIPRDSSNWCADDDYLYVAVNHQCWQIDAYTGRITHVFTLPEQYSPMRYDWGYIARDGKHLYGTVVRKGAIYTDFWGGESWYDSTEGDGTEKVCSNEIFAIDVEEKSLAWRTHSSPMIHPAISVGDGSIYLVESRHEAVQNLETDRVGEDEMWQELYLVALDGATGKLRYENKIQNAPGKTVYFGMYRNGNVFLSSSGDGMYHIYTYDAADGSFQWDAQHKWSHDHHSAHMQHCVVMDDNIYLVPYGYSIETGERTIDNVGVHEGCATYAGASNAFVYRGEARCISMWDRNTGVVTRWTNLRPSCWLSVIPAGGMVLAPEGGGGCSCGNWLETSLAFIPMKSNSN